MSGHGQLRRNDGSFDAQGLLANTIAEKFCESQSNGKEHMDFRSSLVSAATTTAAHNNTPENHETYLQPNSIVLSDTVLDNLSLTTLDQLERLGYSVEDLRQTVAAMKSSDTPNQEGCQDGDEMDGLQTSTSPASASSPPALATSSSFPNNTSTLVNAANRNHTYPNLDSTFAMPGAHMNLSGSVFPSFPRSSVGAATTGSMFTHSNLPTSSTPSNGHRPGPISRRVKVGVGHSRYSGYPLHTAELPLNITFEQVCAQYPNHLWEPILREFEEIGGWTMERIWRHLPADAREAGHKGREWNYLQQRMLRLRREAKRAAASDEDEDEDEDGEDKAPPAKKPRRSRKVQQNNISNIQMSPSGLGDDDIKDEPSESKPARQVALNANRQSLLIGSNTKVGPHPIAQSNANFGTGVAGFPSTVDRTPYMPVDAQHRVMTLAPQPAAGAAAAIANMRLGMRAIRTAVGQELVDQQRAIHQWLMNSGRANAVASVEDAWTRLVLPTLIRALENAGMGFSCPRPFYPQLFEDTLSTWLGYPRTLQYHFMPVHELEFFGRRQQIYLRIMRERTNLLRAWVTQQIYAAPTPPFPVNSNMQQAYFGQVHPNVGTRLPQGSQLGAYRPQLPGAQDTWQYLNGPLPPRGPSGGNDQGRFDCRSK